MFPTFYLASLPPRFPAARPGVLAWQFLCGALLWSGLAGVMHAQELQTQPTPLSAYLDLRPAPQGAEPQNTPPWIEALEFNPAVPTAPTVNVEAFTPLPSASESDLAASETKLVNAIRAPGRPKSVFRIRLQRPVGATDALQLRVFFDDSTLEARPRLTVWNELGTQLMHSAPLGQGLGLPSSETLFVPMTGVDYLEIETKGDGSLIRGVFLSWLAKTRVFQPKDFASSNSMHEPFGILGSAQTSHDDAYLYGVVTAGLQDEKPLVLKPQSTPGATYQFELERQPLLAVVTYEILGASIGASPTVTVNQRRQGESEVHLPDLADPGFRGESEEGRPQMSFRYTGWLRAQKIIPGDALAAGLNNLTLELSNGSKTIAIRSVAIQLKYNWEKFDYILSPAPVPYDSH